MPDPLEIRGLQTQNVQIPEDLWQPLFDRVNIATTVPAENSFFAVPKGQAATLTRGTTTASVTKTARDTNLSNAAVVPAKMFKVMGLSLAYVHGTVANNDTNPNDRSLFRGNAYFSWEIIDKTILTLPVIAIPELNPITGVSTVENATTVVADCGGGGPGTALYRFPVPLVLMPYENFSVTIKVDGTVTLTTTMDVYVFLHAFMRRPT